MKRRRDPEDPSEEEVMRTPPHPRRSMAADAATVYGSSTRSVAKTPSTVKQQHLTQQQLREQYAICIKLANNNKINMKNAFELNIIDFMKPMLRDRELLTFTLATNTLDAGTKVYTARVDAVHQDAIRVANGLALSLDPSRREGDNADQGAEDENENDLDDSEQRQAKKKKDKTKRKKVKTIEDKLDKLNNDKLEKGEPIDPIMRKLRENEMGNVNGLFLANLGTAPNGELTLDSEMYPDKLEPAERRQITEEVDCEDFRDIIERIRKYKPRICPKLATFSFLNRDDQTHDLANLSKTSLAEDVREAPSDYAFDLQADLPPDDLPDRLSPTDHMDVFAQDLNPASDSELDPIMPTDTTGFGADTTIPSQKILTRKSIIRALNLENMPDLHKILAEQPDDYTYFNKKIIGSWAGPQFWRKPGWHKLTARTLKVMDERPPKKGERRKFEPRNFDDPIDETKFKTVNQAALKLKLKTLTGWSQQDNQLPIDFHYDLKKLLMPFLKPNIYYKCVSKQIKKEPLSDDEEVEETGEVLTGEVNRAASTGGIDLDDDRPVSPARSCFDDNDDFMYPASQEPQAVTEGFTDELVEQPYMVDAISLPYAKYAKKIDVKVLKRIMVNIIDIAPPPITQPAETGVISQEAALTTGLSFKNLYKAVPEHKDSTPLLVKNLSEPISFVALLHLANEQELVLENNNDMSDILIKREG